jgi:hypothetical protein
LFEGRDNFKAMRKPARGRWHRECAKRLGCANRATERMLVQAERVVLKIRLPRRIRRKPSVWL